jgi:hypothetical protein
MEKRRNQEKMLEDHGGSLTKRRGLRGHFVLYKRKSQMSHEYYEDFEFIDSRFGS